MTQSHPRALGVNDGFGLLIPGSYKSDKPINITQIDKLQKRCDFISGSILNSIREPILYSFALDKPPGHETNKEPRTKLLKKINHSVLSHMAFCLESDDHNSVEFIGETKSFSCQSINT